MRSMAWLWMASWDVYDTAVGDDRVGFGAVELKRAVFDACFMERLRGFVLERVSWSASQPLGRDGAVWASAWVKLTGGRGRCRSGGRKASPTVAPAAAFSEPWTDARVGELGAVADEGAGDFLVTHGGRLERDQVKLIITARRSASSLERCEVGREVEGEHGEVLYGGVVDGLCLRLRVLVDGRAFR